MKKNMALNILNAFHLNAMKVREMLAVESDQLTAEPRCVTEAGPSVSRSYSLLSCRYF
jgi:hypothetical protein